MLFDRSTFFTLSKIAKRNFAYLNNNATPIQCLKIYKRDLKEPLKY